MALRGIHFQARIGTKYLSAKWTGVKKIRKKKERMWRIMSPMGYWWVSKGLNFVEGFNGVEQKLLNF